MIIFKFIVIITRDHTSKDILWPGYKIYFFLGSFENFPRHVAYVLP